MVTDHSKTYKPNNIKNIVHLHRLNAIKKILKNIIGSPIETYADFGCSNGYITSQIAKLLGAKHAIGFDFSDNVILGQKMHPEILFSRFDLNVVAESVKKHDVVTCFETLEHVGNIESAIMNVLNSRKSGGFALITVPIEIGIVGLFKYALKRFFFRYELPLQCTDRAYIGALLAGDKISKFRAPAISYGTHFGFDFRDVDEILSRHLDVRFKAWNSGTTRFYLIENC